ncbi:MAG: adenylyltransferase/cytidyltransferase family protein [Candidatus Paceibacterota bacterium]
MKNISFPITQVIKAVNTAKNEGRKVVLTLGSWDMLHVGHMRYIEEAKKLGDLLVVGVDSDAKIKERKGKDRPIVKQKERVEMLSHLQHIDLLFILSGEDTSISVTEKIKPSILVLSKTSQNKDNELRLKKSCGSIVVLPAQAETSTTAKIRKLHIDGMKRLYSSISIEINNIIKKEVEKM